MVNFVDNRIPCKNENCKGTILPAIAEKTGIATEIKGVGTSE
jgi:hypothetical protein